MARTTIDDVNDAVAAVRVMQDQIAGLEETLRRLTLRIEALESRLPPQGRNG